MTRLAWTALLSLVLLGVAACGVSGESRVVVAAGTTLVDSGFIGDLAAAYEEANPSAQLSIVGLSSAQAMAYAQAGNADVIITHDPEALDAYLKLHPGALHLEPFTSTFFLVASPALGLGSGSLEETLAVVAQEGYPFVSRDDASGTNAAELDAWASAGLSPRGEPWYTRTGTGMGATLLVTDQRRGVTLTEHGSYLAAAPKLSLVVLGATTIPNPYDLTVIDPAGEPEAERFALWLVSEPGRKAIREANERLYGQQVYTAP